MTATRNIAIELDLGNYFSKDQVLGIRQELMKAIPGLDISLKEYPPIEGQMSLGGIDLSEIVIHALYATAIEVPLHAIFELLAEKVPHIFKPMINNLVMGKFDNKQNQGIVGSIKTNTERKDFIINDKGILEEWKYKPYAINPDRTYAVLVGCSEYRYNIPAIPPVNGNISDLYNLLIDKRHFGLSRDNVEVCLNKESHDIQNLLYLQSRKPGIETFIFYYAGHGFAALNNDYALAATNTEKKGDFINSGVDKKFIENQILENSPALQKIVIVDACYSGILTQSEMPDFFSSVVGTYILTSSGSEEVSLFEKESQNTYFTSALVNTIKSGVPTEQETITLEDLYKYTGEWLSKKKLPLPTYKSGLNIPPAAFSISSNPSYSYESEKSKVEILVSEGKLSEASFLLKRLLKKFPDNSELKDHALALDNDMMFAKLVLEADTSYFREQDYTGALDKYRKALQLKQDAAVQDKINRCIESTANRSKSQAANAQLGEPTAYIHTEKFTAPKSNVSWYKKIDFRKLLAGIVVTFITSVAAGVIIHYVNEGKTTSTQKHDADSAIAKKDTVNSSSIDSTKIPAHENATKQDVPGSNTTQSDGKQKIVIPVSNKLTVKDEANETAPATIVPSLEALSGAVYEEATTTNTISFLNAVKNKIHYQGSIADYTVEGVFINTGNKLKTIDGDLEGELTMAENNNQIISGNLKIKKNDINKYVTLKKKNK